MFSFVFQHSKCVPTKVNNTGSFVNLYGGQYLPGINFYHWWPILAWHKFLSLAYVPIWWEHIWLGSCTTVGLALLIEYLWLAHISEGASSIDHLGTQWMRECFTLDCMIFLCFLRFAVPSCFLPFHQFPILEKGCLQVLCCCSWIFCYKNHISSVTVLSFHLMQFYFCHCFKFSFDVVLLSESCVFSSMWFFNSI